MNIKLCPIKLYGVGLDRVSVAHHAANAISITRLRDGTTLKLMNGEAEKAERMIERAAALDEGDDLVGIVLNHWYIIRAIKGEI